VHVSLALEQGDGGVLERLGIVGTSLDDLAPARRCRDPLAVALLVLGLLLVGVGQARRQEPRDAGVCDAAVLSELARPRRTSLRAIEALLFDPARPGSPGGRLEARAPGFGVEIRPPARRIAASSRARRRASSLCWRGGCDEVVEEAGVGVAGADGSAAGRGGGALLARRGVPMASSTVRVVSWSARYAS
jgi:hypothetical protein